jgi:acid phosphatase (class A)
MKATCAVVAALLIAVSAHAQTSTTSAPAPGKTLRFLTSDEIDPSRLLPPPPEDGSAAQQRELRNVERIVRTRTPERFAQAQWDNEHENATAFASTIGPAFDLTKLPKTAKLLDDVENDQSVAASVAKVYFKRRFPVAASQTAATEYRLWTCDDDVKAPKDRPLRSYPSGHATMGYSVSIVLANLIPEKSQEILARAADYAYSREVCADHYHSDTEASHALGSAVGIMLLNNARLKPEIESAREELRAAHITSR